jgi:hypothetical protein
MYFFHVIFSRPAAHILLFLSVPALLDLQRGAPHVSPTYSEVVESQLANMLETLIMAKEVRWSFYYFLIFNAVCLRYYSHAFFVRNFIFSLFLCEFISLRSYLHRSLSFFSLSFSSPTLSSFPPSWSCDPIFSNLLVVLPVEFLGLRVGMRACA